MPAWIKTVLVALIVAAITGAASARLTVETRLVRLETQMVQVLSLLEEVRGDVKKLPQKE
jgi:hypothetical protein